MMIRNLSIHKKDLAFSLFLLIISYSIFTFNLEGQKWDDWYATSLWNTISWDWENLLTPSEFAAGRTLSPVFGSVTLVFA